MLLSGTPEGKIKTWVTKYIMELSVIALSGNTDIMNVSRTEMTLMVEHQTAQTQLACQSDAVRQPMAGFHYINLTP